MKAEDDTPSLPTRLIHQRQGRGRQITVNPAIERASTLLFRSEADLYGPKPTYGRMGLGVHRELEAALSILEEARHVRLAGNGLQACALGIASVVRSGGHVLMTDSLYGPTARFCEKRLLQMGVETERFDPRIGEAISGLFRDNTQAVILESPGSLTFEISDLPVISRLARQRGIRTVCDNTWGAGLYHKPLLLGADISIQALTKYPAGHSDIFGGAVMTNDPSLAEEIAACSEDWGIALGPDEAWLCLRGLRTLPTRLKAHEKAGLVMADWLSRRPEVAEILHPAFDTHPDHALWKRDFTGSCGLFGIILEKVAPDGLDRFFSALKLFGMGFSWGGFESLIIPCDEQLGHRQKNWQQNKSGPLLRLHIGLEDTDDLKADLEAGFAAMAGAGT